MNSIDPIKKAEILREKMMKDGKYLITKFDIQEQNTGKVLDAYFRYKNYIDNKEWFSASLKDIWSPKFLGLTQNFWSVPIEQTKKLEFQNPPYSAAYRLDKDPREYNKVFTIQLSGCDYDCNYCYVPRESNVANIKFGKYFSVKEIVNYFLSAAEKSKEPIKVMRISGGNPTIIPEIILDIYNEIRNQNLNIYLWIDTNLSSLKYLEDLKSDFEKILVQKNIGVVGCFKGTCNEDFSLITGAEPHHYEKQFETAKWFLNRGADFYAYLPALVYGNNVEEKSRKFIKRLKNLNKNLPLRTEVLEIISYPWAKLNFERTKNLGRPLPKTNQKLVFDIWYNKLLPQFYSQENLNKYCCEMPLK